MATLALVNRGAKVQMIDAGISNIAGIQPPEGHSFLDLRKTDKEQWRWLLGSHFEALGFNTISTGSHLGPQRQHIHIGTQDWIPLQSDDFSPLETLARGGLGEAWGLGTYVYNDKELVQAGLDPTEMKMYYQEVVNHIGVSGAKEDLKTELCGELQGIQEPIMMDSLVSSLYSRYQKKRAWFKKHGIAMDHASLALLTKPYDGREACSYDELDFYRNDPAAWRPEITLSKLDQSHGFEYVPGKLATSFREIGGEVKLECFDINTDSLENLTTDRLILACGPLATARIAMRSLEIDELPFLCNPYRYIAAVKPGFMGRNIDEARSALAQAMLIIDSNGKQSQNLSASIYSYRSLMLYRLLLQVPILPFREALRMVRFIAPSLVLAGLHFPDLEVQGRSLRLERDANSKTGDKLYAENIGAKNQYIPELRLFRKALCKMGCFPVKTINPGFGSSIHYAGTLPFEGKNGDGYISRKGLLRNCSNVYVADASGFLALPAKGITLTLMANAMRVASLIDNDNA